MHSIRLRLAGVQVQGRLTLTLASLTRYIPPNSRAQRTTALCWPTVESLKDFSWPMMPPFGPGMFRSTQQARSHSAKRGARAALMQHMSVLKITAVTSIASLIDRAKIASLPVGNSAVNSSRSVYQCSSLCNVCVRQTLRPISHRRLVLRGRMLHQASCQNVVSGVGTLFRSSRNTRAFLLVRMQARSHGVPWTSCAEKEFGSEEQACMLTVRITYSEA